MKGFPRVASKSASIFSLICNASLVWRRCRYLRICRLWWLRLNIKFIFVLCNLNLSDFIPLKRLNVQNVYFDEKVYLKESRLPPLKALSHTHICHTPQDMSFSDLYKADTNPVWLYFSSSTDNFWLVCLFEQPRTKVNINFFGLLLKTNWVLGKVIFLLTELK